MPDTVSRSRSMEQVHGWGRSSPVSMHRVVPTTAADIVGSVADRPPSWSPMLARGLGRSYGDAAQLHQGDAVTLDRFHTMRWLDRSEGRLLVGAGVTIADLIGRFVPQGWFVPVTPGTRNVTVGGAIAADIHGKNHHRDGSWCDFVDAIDIVVATVPGGAPGPALVRATRTTHADLFQATCGGMGLTGVIVGAEIRMAPIASSTLQVDTRRTSDLDELMTTMEESDAEHRFSVAWVDFMHPSARGVLTQGDFAPDGALRSPGTPAASIPRIPLPRVVQPPFVRAFNELWFRKAPAEPRVTDESITAFFHPLDAIADWNRLYGAGGFHQWQFAVPDDARPLVASVAAQLHEANAPAFFAVLKRFGPGNDAPLSFPISGWTLALDVPAGDPATMALLDRLDDQVVEAGGRIYLAKDARLNPDLLPRMYPRLDEWRATRRAWDPERRFDSDLARRLNLQGE